MTTKSLSRRFRKFLRRHNRPFPRSGQFTLFIDGSFAGTLPSRLLKKQKTECVPLDISDDFGFVVPETQEEPAPLPSRPVFKKIVREPAKEGGRRRTEYKEVKNPKPSETYYAKIGNRWQEVPAAYADPNYQLPA